ncbi:MAG: carbohydrate binding family 9 domain-containing protein, partial [Gemmatimonadetes bacterium]|nr:carbohydrate binding family 9 domain-containing protein [Gemmatimonadota bacterium]
MLPRVAAAQAGGDTRSAENRGARRNAEGRLELIATRAQSPIRIDGVLDEPVWQSGEAATGFVQAEPREGQPASERTEVRIAFDDANLYIAARLFDTEPDRIVVNDIRKDFRAEDQDAFELILDTFNDHRNGYVFRTNAEGARGDQQVANEGREVNASWDAVWYVSTQQTPEGWTAEFAIPFRALRFHDGATDGMVWGINFSRRIRRRNEVSFWSPVPRAYNLNRVSLAGTLAGLPQAAGGRDLRIKPYAAARTIRETGGSRFTENGDAGLDLKYGIAEGLTLDFTLNPDFAQVEVDEQQVNLTQFSQFFPEKREFFLENSGVFYVGDAARNNRVFLTPTPDEDLLLFFSRRIGLTPSGREIPILAGARITGQAAGFVVGGLTMQTREDQGLPANHYSVVRLRRNIASA